jgi:long-chain acyl-CoA synthetase
MERYEELVTGLYDGSEAVDMEVTITYQDGRESDERGHMQVVDVDQPVVEEPAGVN